MQQIFQSLQEIAQGDDQRSPERLSEAAPGSEEHRSAGKTLIPADIKEALPSDC